jgi:uncharacterized membrane protein YhaH (DUF805 family)
MESGDKPIVVAGSGRARTRTSMRKPERLLRYWFTFDESVTRRDYLRHGGALVLLKYAVDAALVLAATGNFWSPLDYFRSAPFLIDNRLEGAAGFLAPSLVAWTLPFLWIGISLTIRRLLDAGWSAWWSLLFFVPLLNYALIAVLLAVPGAPPRLHLAAPLDAAAPRLPRALLSIAFGALFGLLMVAMAVFWIESYGLALFMGTPFVIGLVTAYVLCRQYPASLVETIEVVFMTVVLTAGAGLVIGLEGAVCLAMAAPLALVIAWMGGVTGRFMASIGESPGRGAALIIVLLPGGAALESGDHPAALREVTTAVVIDAPAEQVWDHVVSFSPMPAPRAIVFRLGVAYPVRAEIRGEGVGAIRYCVFSTGAFVEPITAWEPGSRLAFDVIESPRPLEELSIRPVSPPHLDGYLLPRRGEFRLVPLDDGRTRLEGSTWYEQRLRPAGYWVLFSDYLIGRIHRRVLEHIRAEAEGWP